MGVFTAGVAEESSVYYRALSRWGDWFPTFWMVIR